MSSFGNAGEDVYKRQTQAYLDYYGVSETTAKAREFGGVLVNNSDMLDAHDIEDVRCVVRGQRPLHIRQVAFQH